MQGKAAAQDRNPGTCRRDHPQVTRERLGFVYSEELEEVAQEKKNLGIVAQTAALVTQMSRRK